MRIFFEKFQRLIAEKTLGRGRVVMSALGAAAFVAVLATALLILRPGETEQVASDEPNAEATSAVSDEAVPSNKEAAPSDKQVPDTQPEEAAVNEPAGNANLGGVVPTTSTPPPETTAAPKPEPEPAAPAPPAEPTPPPAGGPSAEAWAKLRDCEASGRYDAVNPAGYYGAYQFNQGTWDSVAKSSGRNDLVGVNPAKAAPADQDAMAFALYASRGAQPWPTCGRFL